MLGRLHSLFGAFAIVVALTSAAAAQANIDECEKIQAADAYNQCLAKFGPTSKLKNLEPGKPSDFKGSGEEAAAGAAPLTKSQARSSRHAGRRYGRTTRHVGHSGRQRMVISVGGGRHRRHR